MRLVMTPNGPELRDDDKAHPMLHSTKSRLFQPVPVPPPVIGPSRDRVLRGKARRKARKNAR